MNNLYLLFITIFYVFITYVLSHPAIDHKKENNGSYYGNGFFLKFSNVLNP